jgi:hypothetical protein
MKGYGLSDLSTRVILSVTIVRQKVNSIDYDVLTSDDSALDRGSRFSTRGRDRDRRTRFEDDAMDGLVDSPLITRFRRLLESVTDSELEEDIEVAIATGQYELVAFDDDNDDGLFSSDSVSESTRVYDDELFSEILKDQLLIFTEGNDLVIRDLLKFGRPDKKATKRRPMINKLSTLRHHFCHMDVYPFKPINLDCSLTFNGIHRINS